MGKKLERLVTLKLKNKFHHHKILRVLMLKSYDGKTKWIYFLLNMMNC